MTPRSLAAALASVLADWTPPDTIGELRVERMLGRGGMGSVWLARDTLLDRDVAIKFGDVVSEERWLRARVEARAIARLAHPNILRVHRASDLGDRPMLVTELLSGKSLDRLDLPLPWTRVATIGADLARALAAAHGARILHRDVKPANAFLCDDGVTKLLDFGLAQLKEIDAERASGTETSNAHVAAEPGSLDDTVVARTSSGGILGTPLYMAPETWRGQPATVRTDVYSLGALLFELLTGTPPYLFAQVSELRAAAVVGLHPDLAPLAPSAPTGLVELVTRCLLVDPGRRPEAREVCHTLEALVAPPIVDEGPELDPSESPYRGLLPFGPEHRAVFFGRKQEAAAVVDALVASPFVLVSGPSGAGKSSVVRAGVIPRLRASGWRAVVTVPGRRPLERLAQAVAMALDLDEEGVAARLRASPEALGALLGHARVLVFVDQLEEAWTLAGSLARGDLFAALGSLGPRARVVAALRADFLDRLGDLPGRRATVLVGPMSEEGLREAVAGPARQRGVATEPALVDVMVAAAHGAAVRSGGEETAGALPLLEFALAALWERRGAEKATLGLADLEAIGGLEGALAGHADATLDRMTGACRSEARRLLLALVTVERTRARREDRELGLASPDARAALDALVSARLLVASSGDEGAAYEIAHEAIVRGWPPLRGWLDEEQGSREAAARLADGAAEWERGARAEEALLGARQLSELAGLAALDASRLPAGAEAFVAASRAALRRARRRRLGMALGLPLAVVAIAGAVVGARAWKERRETDAAVVARLAEARAAQAEAIALDAEAEAARREALARYDANDWPDGEARWPRVLALAARAGDRYSAAAAAASLALAADPRRVTSRALAADVASRWLLAAERDHDAALAAELTARLGLLDDDGSRRARLAAPARLRVETSPPGASIVLRRVRIDDRGARIEDGGRAIAAAAPLELAPGSYLLTATAPGRFSTRMPVSLTRGEDTQIEVPLPAAGDVPAGFVYVPAGDAFFGAPDVEAVRHAISAEPEHHVHVDAFLAAERETTFAEYLEFLATLPAERDARRPHAGRDLDMTFDAGGVPTLTLYGVTARRGEPLCRTKRAARRCQDWLQMPVAGISWDDAVVYMAWLARARVPGARLCTEREWERAARGADDRAFPWGDEAHPGDADFQETYDVDAERMGEDEVGSFPIDRSPLGLSDLGGNVAEWVGDVIDASRPATRVARGGLWYYGSLHARAASRACLDGARVDDVGVRACASAKTP